MDGISRKNVWYISKLLMEYLENYLWNIQNISFEWNIHRGSMMKLKTTSTVFQYCLPPCQSRVSLDRRCPAKGRSWAQDAAAEGWTAAWSLQRKGMLTLDRNVILKVYDIYLYVIYQTYLWHIQKLCVEYSKILIGISRNYKRYIQKLWVKYLEIMFGISRNSMFNIQKLWVDYNQRFICYKTVLYSCPWRWGPAQTQAFPSKCLDECFAFQCVNFVPEGWASPMVYWTLQWAHHSSHCPPVHEGFAAARSGSIGQGLHITSTSIQWGCLPGIQAPGRQTRRVVSDTSTITIW